MRFTVKCLIICFLSALHFSVYSNDDNVIPVAKQGIINLSEWNYEKNGIVKLNGEWEFYWKELLEPEDFINPDLLENKIIVCVPSSWTKLMLDSIHLSHEGFATYRLKIKVNSKNLYYCLKINSIYTNYKLWINGEFVNEIGQVGTSKEMSVPKFLSKEYPINLHSKDSINNIVEIITQVSNFWHLKSGIIFPVYFGTNEEVLKDTKNTIVLNLIIVGIILIIGINHLFHYILRRSDRSNLYFGILCIVMILRNITTNDRILSFWIPNINWELLVKLDNFSGFGTIPFFALFLYVLFRKDFPQIIMNILVIAGLAIAMIIFFTPTTVSNQYQTYFELYVLVGGLYLTFGVLLVASIKGRHGALLTFIGFFVLYGTAINDVLSNMGLVDSAYIAPYGLVFYMVLQSFMITRLSARAMKENEILTAELSNEKGSLEKRIQERTEELHLRNRELIKTRRKEMRNNWTNEGLAIISDVLSRKRNNIEELSKAIVSVLIQHLNAQMGVLYLINEEKDIPSLDLIATYGCDKDIIDKNHFMLGEGLIGSCFANGKTIHIKEVPDDYFKLTSGLGEAKPSSVIILPLKYEEEVVGIIEFASFNYFKDYQIAFLEKVASNIASTITILRINVESVKLSRQFNDQEKAIIAKDKEIKKNLKEIKVLKEKIGKLKK